MPFITALRLHRHTSIDPFDFGPVTKIGVWCLNRRGAGRQAVPKSVHGIPVRREGEDNRGEEAVPGTPSA